VLYNVNQGLNQAASVEMKRYFYSRGYLVPALERRREAEANLFLS